MRLRGRFAAATGTLVLAVVAGAMASVYFWERQYLGQSLRTECESSAARLARVAEEALSASNDVLWLNYAKAWLETPGTLEASVVNADGRVYLHTALLRGDTKLVGKRAPHADVALASIEAGGLVTRLKAGENRLVAAVPVERLKKPFGAMVAVYDWEKLLARRNQALAATASRLAAVGLGALVLGLLLAWRLAANLSRPLTELSGAVEAMGTGDLSRRVAERGRDEMGELGRKFNVMSRQLKELLDAREKLLAAVSHDMRSPISILLNSLERAKLVLERGSTEGLREDLDSMAGGLEELSRFVDDILDLAQLQAGLGLSPAPMELGPFLEELRRIFARDAVGYGLTLEVALKGPLRPILADGPGLKRVLSNLILNAFRFTPQGGRIVLGARAGPETAQLWVSDTGPGIAPEDMPKLFSRFHKSRSGAKAARRMPSTGLGLAICKEIVEAQGGRIWAESRSGQGALFAFTVPYA